MNWLRDAQRFSYYGSFFGFGFHVSKAHATGSLQRDTVHIGEATPRQRMKYEVCSL